MTMRNNQEMSAPRAVSIIKALKLQRNIATCALIRSLPSGGSEYSGVPMEVHWHVALSLSYEPQPQIILTTQLPSTFLIDSMFCSLPDSGPAPEIKY